MSAKILDGRKCAEEIEKELVELYGECVDRPKLLILTDYEDPASRVYINNKLKAAERCGVQADVVRVKRDVKISNYVNLYRNYDGIIVQLPMRDMAVAEFLIKYIPPIKDVDGLRRNSGYIPCTPLGIVTLLERNKIKIAGKHVVIIGRSDLVGRPLAKKMLSMDATVTVCHSKTENLKGFTLMADILVVATGKPYLISGDMVKTGAVVVDVGINRVGGKIMGDVIYNEVKEVAGWITPVPGGVGPMTVASLMSNVCHAHGARMLLKKREGVIYGTGSKA